MKRVLAVVVAVTAATIGLAGVAEAGGRCVSVDGVVMMEVGGGDNQPYCRSSVGGTAIANGNGYAATQTGTAIANGNGYAANRFGTSIANGNGYTGNQRGDSTANANCLSIGRTPCNGNTPPLP